ncbi:hypothetical protein TNCV_3913361 [Trichonephila clavipes]|nr:hypothetical protein TNCV_3913361 [Trichonephila clavipes]
MRWWRTGHDASGKILKVSQCHIAHCSCSSHDPCFQLLKSERPKEMNQNSRRLKDMSAPHFPRNQGLLNDAEFPDEQNNHANQWLCDNFFASQGTD